MSPVSASAVSSLRARTGVSILAVKQALEEADGNEEKAIELLRKRGIAQAVKKADRGQAEGGLFIAQKDGKAVVVQLKCETDFVGLNADFIKLGQTLAETFLKDGHDALKKKAEELLPAAIQKLGENISIGETQELEAEEIGTYVHSNRKIAVIVGIDKKGGDYAAKAKDAAMHAAAMNPLYVHPNDVPAESIEMERGIWKEQMSKEKKPPEIMEKIMLGKEKKFREENALVTQAFVKDPSMTVGKYLGDATVQTYVRVAI